jgi:cob(I)alamin adenosyltransferase
MNSLVYVFTGEGKGKTSAALGMALRAVCDDKNVAWVAWYKEPDWKVSEYRAPEILGKNFIMYVDGKGFYLGKALPSVITEVGNVKVAKTKAGAVVDKVKERAHWQAAQQALAHARMVIDKQEHDLLICDELCQAAGEGLLNIEDVLALIKDRGKTHLVLTGRNCPSEIIEIADTVTEMKKIKHAYDKGIGAVKGLDF